MPITRDQASRLLTQPEMGLFGDSRNPALRALSEKALASRVARTRKLRDKSYALLQRQKLKSRESTGNKLGTSGVANQRTGKKGEILDDMLQRFESRLQEVQAADKPAVLAAGKSSNAGVTARKAAARKTPSESKTTRARKTTARIPAAKPSARTNTAAITKPGTSAKASEPAKAARTAKAAATQAAKPVKPVKRVRSSPADNGPGQGNSRMKPKTPPARSRKTAITPERALENTRALLEAKQQRELQPPAYLSVDTHAGTEHPSPGFQSGGAESKALELHEGEIRMEAIHGSISTRDRRNQGQRDKG